MNVGKMWIKWGLGKMDQTWVPSKMCIILTAVAIVQVPHSQSSLKEISKFLLNFRP